MPKLPAHRAGNHDANHQPTDSHRNAATRRDSAPILLEQVVLVDMTDEQYEAAVDALANVFGSLWGAEDPRPSEP
jgi:hypothetical protein